MNPPLSQASASIQASTSIGSTLQQQRQDFHGVCQRHGDAKRPQLPEPTPASYSTPNAIIAALSEEEAADLYTLAEAIVQDPAQVRQLGDRVYEMLQQDIRYQRDRNGTLRR
ncbi:MAG: hypothetical protein AB4042_15865 [Leptolyngbyaceae cyanobacterium]